MLIYLLRRLLLMIPTLFGITLVVFTIMALSPGGLTGAALVGADLNRSKFRPRSTIIISATVWMILRPSNICVG